MIEIWAGKTSWIVWESLESATPGFAQGSFQSSQLLDELLVGIFWILLVLVEFSCGSSERATPALCPRIKDQRQKDLSKMRLILEVWDPQILGKRILTIFWEPIGGPLGGPSRGPLEESQGGPQREP